MIFRKLPYLVLLFIGAFAFLFKSISNEIRKEQEERSSQEDSPETVEDIEDIEDIDEIDEIEDIEDTSKTTPIENVEGLTPILIKKLKDYKITTLEQAQAMSSEELLALKGIGQKTVDILKK